MHLKHVIVLNLIINFILPIIILFFKNTYVIYFRMIQKNFVDMENMFDLMREEQEVVDIPNAKELTIKNGGIEFSDVSFSYTPERRVLKNISFLVPPGKTVALV